eukprot:5239137-Pleurochrysis_carterae.AAC.2
MGGGGRLTVALAMAAGRAGVTGTPDRLAETLVAAERGAGREGAAGVRGHSGGAATAPPLAPGPKTLRDAPADRLDGQAVGAARGDGRGGETGVGRGGVTAAVHAGDAHGRVVCAGVNVGERRGGASDCAARLWRLGQGVGLLERQVRRPPALGSNSSLERVVCTPGADGRTVGWDRGCSGGGEAARCS